MNQLEAIKAALAEYDRATAAWDEVRETEEGKGVVGRQRYDQQWHEAAQLTKHAPDWLRALVEVAEAGLELDKRIDENRDDGNCPFCGISAPDLHRDWCAQGKLQAALDHLTQESDA